MGKGARGAGDSDFSPAARHDGDGAGVVFVPPDAKGPAASAAGPGAFCLVVVVGGVAYVALELGLQDVGVVQDARLPQGVQGLH